MRKALALCLLLVSATVSAAAPQGAGAVRCGRLLDVRSGKLLADQVVVFAGGRITAVGPAASTAPPPGVTPADLSGATCLPGLIDAHAGVDSIEHGSYIDEEGIRLMKQHGTYLVPTSISAIGCSTTSPSSASPRTWRPRREPSSRRRASTSLGPSARASR
jgi:imidazolonepropionase-like amidohydrolase